MTQQKDSTRQVGLARIYRSWPIIFIAAVGIYVVFKYFSNVGSLLPFIIIALCPLMHIFMHRGHGGHKSQRLPEVKADQTEPTEVKTDQIEPSGAEDGFHG
jgi:hypothetical protein